MEALLSVSFDNISSKDGSKIRKGLRQIEGLLTQLCLPPSTPGSGRGRRSSVIRIPQEGDEAAKPPPKTLVDLPYDPAFQEFFRLQDGFEWNVTSKLVDCMERLLGISGDSGSNDSMLLSGLTLLHGVLLLHPPSRKLFKREPYMNLILDLMDTCFPPAIQSAALLALITALLGQPQNTRVFEAMDGLLTVSSLFKSRSTPRPVRDTLLEFFTFYLQPETPTGSVRSSRSEDSSHSDDTWSTNESGAYSSGRSAFRPNTSGSSLGNDFMSVDEKQKCLARYLTNVDDIVQEAKLPQPVSGRRPASIAV